MSGYDIYSAVGRVSDKYIEESMNYWNCRRYKLRRTVILVACIAVLVGILLTIPIIALRGYQSVEELRAKYQKYGMDFETYAQLYDVSDLMTIEDAYRNDCNILLKVTVEKAGVVERLTFPLATKAETAGMNEEEKAEYIERTAAHGNYYVFIVAVEKDYFGVYDGPETARMVISVGENKMCESIQPGDELIVSGTNTPDDLDWDIGTNARMIIKIVDNQTVSLNKMGLFIDYDGMTVNDFTERILERRERYHIRENSDEEGADIR